MGAVNGRRKKGTAKEQNQSAHSTFRRFSISSKGQGTQTSSDDQYGSSKAKNGERDNKGGKEEKQLTIKKFIRDRSKESRRKERGLEKLTKSARIRSKDATTRAK